MTVQPLAQPKPSGDPRGKVVSIETARHRKVTTGHAHKPARRTDLPPPIPGHEWRVDGAGFSLWAVWRELDPRTGKRTRKRRRYMSYCSRRALQILQEVGYETVTAVR